MNRRKLLKGLPAIITVPAILDVGSAASVASASAGQAWERLAEELRDEHYRQAIEASISWIVLSSQENWLNRPDLKTVGGCNYLAKAMVDQLFLDARLGADPARDPSALAPIPSGKTITTAEAFACLADALNTDEGYRQTWIANIAVLLNDCATPESKESQQLRQTLGIAPHRVVDPQNLDDCNYFAERLIQRIFGTPVRSSSNASIAS